MPDWMQPVFCKMSIIRFAIVLAAFTSTSAVAADQTFKLAVGQPAVVELETNPSTGYGWAIDGKESANLSILRIDDRGVSNNAAGKPLPGAPGIHRWSIEPMSAGTASITFVYRRPWETSIARRHQVVIDATSR
jgi:inhibitor of cysteine peptidase